MTTPNPGGTAELRELQTRYVLCTTGVGRMLVFEQVIALAEQQQTTIALLRDDINNRVERELNKLREVALLKNQLEEQQARIEALEKRVAEERERADGNFASYERVKAQSSVAHNRVKELEAALRECISAAYFPHANDCDMKNQWNPKPCDCGVQARFDRLTALLP